MNNLWILINEALKNNKTAALGTVVSSKLDICPAGTKFLISAAGCDDEIVSDIFGCLNKDHVQLLKESYHEVIGVKSPKIVSLPWDEESIKIFLDPIYLRAHLLVLGGGHISVPLVAIAKLLNYQVTVVDDRPTFANPLRFPDADSVICNDFAAAIQALSVHNNTYAVVVTRGHSHDKTCLAEMLKKENYPYLGMIGSKRKIALLFQELSEEGFDHSQLSRIYTPIGLDIGAQTPEEIAVSILSEIIMISRLGYSNRQVK